MSLSTHLLDTSAGRPAAGVALRLERWHNERFEPIGHGTTDADGRCRSLLGNAPLEEGTYRLRFDTGPYFTSLGVQTLYPYVEITFAVHDPSQHHHIPLLIAANGYTTYRGS